MLDRIDLAALRRQLGARLITPTDDGYEILRLVDNGAIDRRPEAIARAAGIDDVAAVVAIARSSGLPLAVRSGGHSVAGYSTGDGVLVLDLSLMNGLDLDESTRTARAGAGVRAGEYTRAAYEIGLATPFGDTGNVGIGGLTLGGGIGWLVRKHGLTIDNLLAVEVVTATGERVVASADENADLFWALRGGGGNFGVATRFTLRLHPIGSVLHGTIAMPATADVLGGLVAIGLAAPDELTLMPAIMPMPPILEVPAAHHGALTVFVDLLWAGPIDRGRRAIRPIRALARPILDDVEEKPYPDVYPQGPRNRDPWTSRAIFLPGFDAETVEIIARHMAAAPSDTALLHARILGGAAARVPNDATAFGWRDQAMLLWIIADFTGAPGSELPIHDRWAAELRAALGAKGTGTYVNFMADESGEAVRSAYPGATWDRLRAVKALYDPENLFRLNQNVPPA